jgi:Swi5-dependent recombination DNA repair protein 1
MDQNNSRRQGDFYSHAAKRRRVEAASHTLSKPFRSPFKAATKPQDVRECSVSASPPATSDEKRPVGLAHTHGRTPFSPSPSRTAEPRRWSRATFSNEPILNLLLKEERGLERELRELKVELDAVEQARKIEMKEEDEELVGLIEKWKGAARAAAEEVFRKVSDRVNRYA